MGNVGQERAVHGEELAGENGDGGAAKTVYARECGRWGAIYRPLRLVAN